MGLFRRLFGAKKPGNSPPAKEKRRWSFVRSSNTNTKTTPSSSSSLSNKRNDNTSSLSPYEDGLDANKHAIAVAAATAAVAEAALAAAQAAAEVVRLTGGGGGGVGVRCATSAQFSGGTQTHYRWAAVKIQSAFRGYLARRALRALKALVKLQALVRGHIVRKQTADMLRRMQTLVRLQARARASRAHVSESFHSINKPYNSRNAVFANPNKDEQQLHAYSTKFDGPSILKRCGSHSNLRDIISLDKARMGSNWLDCWMEESVWNNHRDTTVRHRQADDERNDKILEVDTWKPHLNSQQKNRTFRASQHVLASDYNSQSYMPIDSPSKLSTKAPNRIPSVSSGEVSSLGSLKFPIRRDEAALRTSENSPQMFSASSRPGSSSARRGPFTPTRSECSWGYFSGYSGHPNYMANTESSRAKVRSQSAPRQRLEFERYGSARRSVLGILDASTNSEMGFAQLAEFRNKAYPASGCLNRLGSANLR